MARTHQVVSQVYFFRKLSVKECSLEPWCAECRIEATWASHTFRIVCPLVERGVRCTPDGYIVFDKLSSVFNLLGCALLLCVFILQVWTLSVMRDSKKDLQTD